MFLYTSLYCAILVDDDGGDREKVMEERVRLCDEELRVSIL